MKLVDGLTEEDYGVSVSAMLQYVVDYLDNEGMLEDHVFTFPDGSTWVATGHHTNKENERRVIKCILHRGED